MSTLADRRNDPAKDEHRKKHRQKRHDNFDPRDHHLVLLVLCFVLRCLVSIFGIYKDAFTYIIINTSGFRLFKMPITPPPAVPSINPRARKPLFAHLLLHHIRSKSSSPPCLPCRFFSASHRPKRAGR